MCSGKVERSTHALKTLAMVEGCTLRSLRSRLCARFAAEHSFEPQLPQLQLRKCLRARFDVRQSGRHLYECAAIGSPVNETTVKWAPLVTQRQQS
jgi:hypothetical protein